MRCPTLEKLPPPPPGKHGWPWTVATDQLGDILPNGRPWPRITVVTPSYNQGQFIEETIRSVLLQGYPNLEYIVMDGGSTDNSAQIIRKYQKHISWWTTERDHGQSDAINKGFARATGSILAWLNSDDVYFPNALARVALKLNPTKAELLFGNCQHVRENDRVKWGSDVTKQHALSSLALYDYIIQPSTFWTRKATERTGLLDESLVFAFDWDWFIRAERASVVFKADDEYLAVYRIHDDHKSGMTGNAREVELALIYERYAGLEYGDLFLRCSKNYGLIAAIRKWTRRLRLKGSYIRILWLVLPNLFRGFSANEISDVLRMAGLEQF